MRASTATALVGCCLVLISMGSCSRQQVYDSVQNNQRQECSKYSGSRLDECMRGFDLNFDDYQQQREDVLGDKSSD